MSRRSHQRARLVLSSTWTNVITWARREKRPNGGPFEFRKTSRRNERTQLRWPRSVLLCPRRAMPKPRAAKNTPRYTRAHRRRVGVVGARGRTKKYPNCAPKTSDRQTSRCRHFNCDLKLSS